MKNVSFGVEKSNNSLAVENELGVCLRRFSQHVDRSGSRFNSFILINEPETQELMDIDVLLPNGTMVSLKVELDCTFFEIKEEVLELAQKGPMYGALRDPQQYIFAYVDAESCSQKEVDDEEIRLCDASPFGELLRLLERKEDSAALELDEQIGQLIGKSLKDFDALCNPEVNEFRYRMRTLCEEIVKTRQCNSWLDKMRYAYPTAVETFEKIPDYFQRRIGDNSCIQVKVSFESASVTVELSVKCTITCDELILQAINQLTNDEKMSQLCRQLFEHFEPESYYDTSFGDDPAAHLLANRFLLKINGLLEYLLENRQLIHYKTIQELILDNKIIHLIAIRRHSIEFEDEPIYSVPEFTTTRSRSQSVISLGGLSSSHLSARRRPNIFSSWAIDRKLVIRINSAQRIYHCQDISRVAVMAGIFHGGESLCESLTTSSILLAPASNSKNPQNLETFNVTWDEDIVFNLKVSDLARMARLCFAIVGYSGGAAGKKITKSNSNPKPIPLSWANINFYDYRGILWETSTTLSMWPHTDDDETEDLQSMFSPLGTVVQNPATDQTTLTISFTKYSEGDNSIIRYPDTKEIVKFQATNGSSIPIVSLRTRDDTIAENEYECTYESTYELQQSSFVRSLTEEHRQASVEVFGSEEEEKIQRSSTKNLQGSKQFLDQIKEISDRDLLHKMSDQECELVWFLRQDCRQVFPNSLNKLLISFKWNNQKLIGETVCLLQSWPKLSPSKALELLDYAYADSLVRKFAIECLRELSNEQLSQYLLQLVQALKYESYIYNDLVQFLLERAFENQRIGHSLFWLLRSEMHDPAVSVTFGLILEAYCRGAVDHIYILSRQVECLNKLKRINEIIRDDKSGERREKKIALMQDILAQKFYQETLCNVINPLNPVYKFGNLVANRCKFMDSKMKPLWVVFENFDSGAENVYIIFKNGDDLRQDMLTLQMIRIMDRLWKEEGYDFRMTPYRCISVEHNVGLIEVVLNADTIANIQKEKGSAAIAAFKKGSLFAWIKDHNPTEEALSRAVEQFTLSCAGYCVATYILGIADRHNDNIMVKKNGQMFHIDFGHILGKFKEKFGIRRERVPFVLTNDFVYVITHGEHAKKKEYFNRFQQYCEEAFLIIRRKGSFIISLFAMMLSTGIPEISSVNDLNYLRDTLVLDLSEEQARNHFRTKFTEALKNSWKTSFNWCAHSIAKDNRMTE